MRFQVIVKYIISAGIIFRIITLNASGFWLDEALQFWTSKGIPYQQLHKLDAQAQDITWQGLTYNTHRKLLGSPTFTILIHHWSRISNSVFWLRIIPFLFGLGALLLMYFISIGCGFSKNWAFAIAAFCTWNAPWVFYSSELRPYSFEIFCSALTLFILIKTLKNKYILFSHCIWLALSISLGITSGYGYHIYYPFFVVFLVLYVMIKDDDSKIRKFFKVLILIFPVIISLLYVKTSMLKFLITRGFQPSHLTYLNQYDGTGYILNTIKMIIYTISWQLFNVQRLFFYDLPLGLPFVILTTLFLMYSISIPLSSIKEKDMIKCTVLMIFIYSIVICSILSTKGLVPMGPFRHNLFFSPAVFIGFFICIRHSYETFIKDRLKIKEGLALILLTFLLAPSIFRNSSLFFNYEEVVWSISRENWHILLKEIQEAVDANDKIAVYINERSIPAFKYELIYSDIPWVKKLKYEDITTDSKSFKAAANSEYDYQWYMFGDVYSNIVNRVKDCLMKKYDIIMDKEYFLPRQGVAGFRARRKTRQ